jgi:signal transduction histidine kinase
VRFKCRLEGHETAWTEAGDTRVRVLQNCRRAIIVSMWKPATRTGSGANPAAAGRHRAAAILADRLVSRRRHPGFSRNRRRRGAIYSTQKLQRQLQTLKQQEALEKERSRIARDLHDQLGANLTQVALLGEMAAADKHSPAEIESHAQQISQTARETTRSLDEIVWAVNPANDTLDGLSPMPANTRRNISRWPDCATAPICRRSCPPIPIPPEVRHNVFLAFKEAVNNVVKHAQATEARIRLRCSRENSPWKLKTTAAAWPNHASAAQNRNGLRNMRKRMEDIHGEFSISGGARKAEHRATVPI